MDAEHIKKGGTPKHITYENKEYIENEQESYLTKKYLNKKCKTEHGTGFVCGFDLPRSRVWSLMIEITENSGKPILKSMFPDNRMRYDLKEVTFL